MKLLVKNHLLVFAFGFLGLLVFASTVIFNVFWSGCVAPPFAQDNTTIKDYMTLYLSMLGVVATLYASFVVIYAYDNWKEQHNHTTLSELSINIYSSLDELNILVYRFRSYISDINKLETHNDELLDKSNQLYDQIKLMSNLIRLDKLQRFNANARTSVYGIVITCPLMINSNISDKEILDYYYNRYNDFHNSSEEIRTILHRYIMV